MHGALQWTQFLPNQTYATHRPDLTWRDIQHLCVENAVMINEDDPDWETTASGRKYSYKYGFGVLDGYKYVKAAQSWNLVKPQAWLETKTIRLNNGTFGEDKKYQGGEFIPAAGIESKMSITRDMLQESNLEALEHINVKVWINHASRGEVEVEIISPNGIKSVLGGRRTADNDPSGYPGWTFMSVKHWSVKLKNQRYCILIYLLSRGENPIGDWTLKVKDQNKPNSNGTFLGWNMVLWGSTIDPSRATKFEVPLVADRLPPVNIPQRPIFASPSSTSASTKQHAKPTANLPSDHGIATGEKSVPAFTSTSILTSTSISATPSHTLPISSPAAISGTPDFGWFSDMSSLVTGQKWFFGALGAVSIFGIAVAVFFWRRKMAQKAARYTALNNDNDVSMSALGTSISGGPRTTRELYDAFGEVSDDDDDETTALRPQSSRAAGLGFHSGFLDDDEPPTATETPSYRDEPTNHHQVDNHDVEQDNVQDAPVREVGSPIGSADGSWEHASSE